MTGSGTVTGTITFKDGIHALGGVGVTAGKATLTTTSLGAGKHTITAAYSGSSAFNPHVSTPVVITVE